MENIDVILAGDYNDGLSFRNEDGKLSGLYMDLTGLGFPIPDEELQKKTCKSFRGNIYNLDHVLSRTRIMTTYISQDLDVSKLPNKDIPSDHLPVLYEINC